MKVQKFTSALTVLFLSASLMSCQSPKEKPKEKPKKVCTRQTKSQHLKLNISNEPQSLDPRKVRNLVDINLVRMFHDGLIRNEKEDQISLALAKTIEKSADGKTYTVTLKDAYWSNGDKVTSQDFFYSFRSSLSPSFPADYAYQLYVIKNAKAIKEGSLPPSLLGIDCPSEDTLIFHLEQPVPYFEKLLGLPIFFAVNEKIDRANSNWSSSNKTYIGNGPFILSEWVHQDKLTAEKNPKYWDNDQVRLNKIDMIMVNENTELCMFEQEELNWLGSPFSNVPLDALQSLKTHRNVETMPALGTAWIRANTEHPLLRHEAIRQALSYSINRKDIVDHVLLGTQNPTTGIVPSNFHLTTAPYFTDGDGTKALELFNAALEEAGLTKEDFSNLKMIFVSTEKSKRVVEAIQQQWLEILGISVQLQPLDSKVYFTQISNKDYDLGYGSWIGDFNDAVNFLEVFKNKAGSTNNTNWESPNYAEAISNSFYVSSSEERTQLLRTAEEILMQDMPVMPIYEYKWVYMKDPHLKNAYISAEGYLDLKNAVLE